MGNSTVFENLHFEVAGFTFEPNYLQAAAIVGLLFLLILSLARVRRLFVGWSISGWPAWLLMGFLLALILEGFLIIGGRTAITEILGWENAPKPLLSAIDSGREKLVDVLGVTEEVPSSYADEPPSVESVLQSFESLSASEAASIRTAICDQE
jgi:hypothetical protein